MRDDPLFVSWDIHFPSVEAARRAESLLNRVSAPDRLLVDEVRIFPNGFEARFLEPYRIGDYFEEILVVPSPGESRDLRLVFRRIPAAGRHWKAMMVDILQSIRTEIGGVSIALAAKGDGPPN